MRRLIPLVLAAILLLPVGPTAVQADDQGAPLVAIDPGHDASDWGTAGVANGKRLVEKDLTLTVARALSDLLQAAGYRTLLTRTDDAAPNGGADKTGDGKVDLADDLQARVDKANNAGAAILVSIHFNGSTDHGLRGPAIYYSASRPFAAQSRKLADAVMSALTARMGQAGRPITPLGVLRDSTLGGSLYLLGPAGARIVRASNMPGILIEGLFLTNADDAALLADPTTLQTLARGYADGIAAYLGPPPKPLPKRAVVVGPDGAFLRPSPLMATDPLASLPPGTVVNVAEAAKGDDGGDGSTDWYRVDYKGQAGYVFAELLQPTTAGASASGAPTPTAPPPAPSAIRKVTVHDDGDGKAARLRSSPSRGGDIVDRAKAGETLDVLDQADGEAVDGKTPTWLKVRHGTTVGWVWAPLVDS